MTTYTRADLDDALSALADNSLAASEYEIARAVIIAATLSGKTIATAESLTAGLISATLATIPGASNVLRGGIVAYATDLKASALHVPQALLDKGGPIQTPVSGAMAVGARAWAEADFGLACTGVEIGRAHV